ncbi:MAG: hypothetical protein Q8Q08_12915 [Candidatus Omnitrophota bacterium]|nr:hypothetical protein [Candidatus Omnitrophota bacterium]
MNIFSFFKKNRAAAGKYLGYALTCQRALILPATPEEWNRWRMKERAAAREMEENYANDILKIRL